MKFHSAINVAGFHLYSTQAGAKQRASSTPAGSERFITAKQQRKLTPWAGFSYNLAHISTETYLFV